MIIYKYLLRSSAHPTHCTKAIPFGVATRIRRNCSTDQKFEQRSKEYQNYLVSRRYLPHQVKIQFDKAKEIPRRDRLTPKTRDRKVIFPLVTDFNPHFPTSTKLLVTIAILSIIHPNYHRFFLRVPLSHLLEGPKNIKEPLAGPKGSNYTNCYDPLPSGCFKCISKCDLSKNYLRESKIFLSSSTERFYNIRQHVDCKSRNVIYLVTC